MLKRYILPALILISLKSYAVTETVVKKNEASVLTVGQVNGESTNEFSVINVRFDQDPPWKTVYVQDHGNFIQISLPEAITLNPGEFYDGNSPYFKKIVVYQANETQAMLRIFTSVDAAKVKEVCDAEVLANRVVITLDHKALQKILGNEQLTPPTENKKEEITQNEISTPQVETKVVQESVKVEEHEVDYKLKIVAFFSLLAIFLIFAALTLGRIIRTRKILQGTVPGIQMKAISHLNLAPKQRLSLVQVGDETILLSVCPEQISLITHIKDDNSNQVAKRQLVKPEAPKSIAPPKQIAQNTLQNQANKINSPENKPATQPISDNSVQRAKRINYAVGDNGIENKEDKLNASAKKAVDDVTQLIRDKLKSLPKI